LGGVSGGAAAPLPLLGARGAPAVRVGLPPNNMVTLIDIDVGVECRAEVAATAGFLSAS